MMAWDYRQNDLPTAVDYLDKLRSKLDDDRYFTVLKRAEAWSKQNPHSNSDIQLKEQIMQIVAWLGKDYKSIRELNCIFPRGIALLSPPRSGDTSSTYYGTLLTKQGGEILSLEQSQDTGGFHVIFTSDDLLSAQGNETEWPHCVDASLKEGWGPCLADLLSREVDDPSNAKTIQHLAFRRQIDLLKNRDCFPSHLLLQQVFKTRKNAERLFLLTSFAERYRGKIGEEHAEGRAVCLRVFQRPTGRDCDAQANYLFKRDVFREILPWCRLRHHNVLPFLGVKKISTGVKPDGLGRWTLVVPWIERKDILTYIRGEQPDLQFKRNAVCDIIQGLEYLHGQIPPIFHGNLRGSHVLVDEDGTCLLTNFDTYRLTRDHAASATQTAESSEKWQAPEVFTGASLVTDKAAVDVYALGCVIVEIYSGNIPQFGTAGPNTDIKTLVKNGERPDKPSDIPEEMETLMTSCWEKEPANRPKMIDLANEYQIDRALSEKWLWKPQPAQLSEWVAKETPPLLARGARMQEELPKIMYISVDDASMLCTYRHSKPREPTGFLRVLDEAYKQAEAQGLSGGQHL